MNFSLTTFWKVMAVAVVMILFNDKAFAQMSEGGTPPSFRYKSTLRSLDTVMQNRLPALDMRKVEEEDKEDARNGRNPRAGYGLPANTDVLKEGTWTKLPSGEYICRYQFKCEDAVVLSLLFSNFKLTDGDKLFVYNEDGSHVQGAFTSANNKSSGKFATAMLVGNSITLELVSNTTKENNTSIIEISYVVNYYIYKDKIGSRANNVPCQLSGDCQVSINCPEGAGFRDVGNGVARIVFPRGGGSVSFCSGSLINNTRFDASPLFLTANHCIQSDGNKDGDFTDNVDLFYDADSGMGESKADDWMFYWNFDGPECGIRCDANEIIDAKTTTGAYVLANDNAFASSDFALLYLVENPICDNEINAQLNGWDNSNIIYGNSIGIHHPIGDFKMIATDFDSPINSSSKYKTVKFDETSTNHHSVTEGGSSGSPIFNANKLIFGQLRGVNVSCGLPDFPPCCDLKR
ncbi:MAG: hypothetical protein R2774_00960 [Saprospiraceae bacterium]